MSLCSTTSYTSFDVKLIRLHKQQRKSLGETHSGFAVCKLIILFVILFVISNPVKSSEIENETVNGEEAETEAMEFENGKLFYAFIPFPEKYW